MSQNVQYTTLASAKERHTFVDMAKSTACKKTHEVRVQLTASHKKEKATLADPKPTRWSRVMVELAVCIYIENLLPGFHSFLSCKQLLIQAEILERQHVKTLGLARKSNRTTSEPFVWQTTLVNYTVS
eukprot:g19203.t1